MDAVLRYSFTLKSDPEKVLSDSITIAPFTLPLLKKATELMALQIEEEISERKTNL